MRRRSLGVVAGFLVLLAAAVPVAAADRVVDSGTFYQYTTGTFTCQANTCTDTFLDVFSIAPGVVAVCYVDFTFNARTGRVMDELSGCTESSESILAITEDFDVTVASTEIQLFSCTQRRCTEADVVTVSASDSPIGPVTTASGRVTVNEGSCRSRITFTDTSAEIAGTITVDGTSFDASGFATVSEQTVATTCR